jgi:hypothetical protein
MLLMMSKGVLETCRELEYINTKIELCVKLVIYKRGEYNFTPFYTLSSTLRGEGNRFRVFENRVLELRKRR